MQFDGNTKTTSHGSHLVTFDPRPKSKIEDDAHAEAKNFWARRQSSSSTFSRIGSSQGVAPRAQSHSSFVRRTAGPVRGQLGRKFGFPRPGQPASEDQSGPVHSVS